MGFKYNPFTGNLDRVKCDTETTVSTLPFAPNTTFIAGKIINIEEGYDNKIDACSLPITSERQTIDLGTLDELCN